jgi:hypothetical protein
MSKRTKREAAGQRKALLGNSQLEAAAQLGADGRATMDVRELSELLGLNMVLYQERPPTDAEITDWIVRYPNRNGIYTTGACLGRFVVDCDHDDAVQEACRRGIPETQTVLTRRGRHYHLQHPGFRVRNSVSEVYPGIDIRGDGGVAVAVGSVHKTGFIYRWAEGCSPQEVELAPTPDWLIEWLPYRPIEQTTIEPRPFDGVVSAWASTIIAEELEQLSLAPQGTRNAMLARVAFKLGQLAGGGEADGVQLLTDLHDVAAAWPDKRKSYDTIQRCFAEGQLHARVAPSVAMGSFESGWERRRYGKQ